MTNNSVLIKIENLSSDELSTCLELNGFGDCCELVKERGIDGAQFLKITELQLKLWRIYINHVQAKRLYSFIERIRKNPEDFTFADSLKKSNKVAEKGPSTFSRRLPEDFTFADSLKKSNNVGNKKEPSAISKTLDLDGLAKVLRSKLDDGKKGPSVVKQQQNLPSPITETNSKIKYKPPLPPPIDTLNSMVKSHVNDDLSSLPPSTPEIEEMVEKEPFSAHPPLPPRPINTNNDSEDELPEYLEADEPDYDSDYLQPNDINSKQKEDVEEEDEEEENVYTEPTVELPTTNRKPSIFNRPLPLPPIQSEPKKFIEIITAQKAEQEKLIAQKAEQERNELLNRKSRYDQQQQKQDFPIPNNNNTNSLSRKKTPPVFPIPNSLPNNNNTNSLSRKKTPPVHKSPVIVKKLLPPPPPEPEIEEENIYGNADVENAPIIPSKYGNAAETPIVLPKRKFSNSILPPPIIPKPLMFKNVNSYRNTDRKGAEMLLSDLPDGAFLLRQSKKFDCTLNVKYQTHIYNFGIKNDNGFYRLIYEKSDNSPTFKTLEELIKHYMEHPIQTFNPSKQFIIKINLIDVLPLDRN